MRKFFEVELPYPPSVNHIWMRQRKGGVYLNKRVHSFREKSEIILRDADLLDQHYSFPMKMKFEVFHPDQRRRDLANLEKVISDTLSHFNVIEDDVWINEHQMIRLGVKKAGSVKVTMYQLKTRNNYRWG